MKIANMRHKITILEATGTTTNVSGEDVPSYTDWKTVWAAVEPLKGREYLEAQKFRAELTYRIRIRYLAGIKQTMRVNFQGRVFNIESIININEANREMHIICVEQVV